MSLSRSNGLPGCGRHGMRNNYVNHAVTQWLLVPQRHQEHYQNRYPRKVDGEELPTE